MADDCVFSANHKCPKWTDCQLAQLELKEANELCRGNWIEIEHLRKYIDILQKELRDKGIDVPPEY